MTVLRQPLISCPSSSSFRRRRPSRWVQACSLPEQPGPWYLRHLPQALHPWQHLPVLLVTLARIRVTAPRSSRTFGLLWQCSHLPSYSAQSSDKSTHIRTLFSLEFQDHTRLWIIGLHFEGRPWYPGRICVCLLFCVCWRTLSLLVRIFV